MSSLPTDAKKRKEIPIATGFVDYFPSAIAAVAELSRIGGEQHNPGKPLHWDRSKSGDESDALMRHFLQRGTIDTDGVRHSAKVAWRAMALLEKEIEQSLINQTIQPDADGWIKWDGSGVPPKGMVEYMFRCDHKMIDKYENVVDISSGHWHADELRWKHIGSPFDIVAYRIEK